MTSVGVLNRMTELAAPPHAWSEFLIQGPSLFLFDLCGTVAKTTNQIQTLPVSSNASQPINRHP